MLGQTQGFNTNIRCVELVFSNILPGRIDDTEYKIMTIDSEVNGFC